jgi:hypothetical protein
LGGPSLHFEEERGQEMINEKKEKSAHTRIMNPFSDVKYVRCAFDSIIVTGVFCAVSMTFLHLIKVIIGATNHSLVSLNTSIGPACP